MKSQSFSSLLVLSFLLLTTLGLVVAVSTVQERYGTSADAAGAQETCPVNVRVTIEEQLEDGSVVSLDLTNASLDSTLWGFADTINQPPYGDTIIPFNHPEFAEYNVNGTELSFVRNPSEDQVYQTVQNVSLQAFIQENMYSFVSRQIKECSLKGSDDWLCGRSNLDDDVRRISALPFRCDIELEVGWVVKKHDLRNTTQETSTRSQDEGIGFSQNAPVGFISTDLNGDGTVSAIDLSFIIESYGKTDPLADVNKDGKVNVIDFSLVAEQLQK